MKKRNDEFSVKDLLNLFIPKLWLILVCSVLVGLLVGAYSTFLKSDTYTSESLLMVSKKSTTATTNDRDLSSDMIETYRFIIYSDNFLGRVITDLESRAEYASYDWQLTEAFLRNCITITQRGESEIFNITVTTNNKLKSFAIADSVGKEVRESLQKIMPDNYEVIGVSIIDAPKMASAPNDKNVLRNSLVGVLAGMVVTMIVIFVLSMFDVVIHDRKKLEENFDIPVLGVIPRFEVEINTVKESK